MLWLLNLMFAFEMGEVAIEILENNLIIKIIKEILLLDVNDVV